MNKNILIIFAKWPEPGRVKTRLAARIGAYEAAAQYRIMVETVVRQTTPNGNFERVLCFAPPAAAGKFQEWLPEIAQQYPQCSGDLGERMASAFSECFARGAEKACIIGTDCLNIDSQLLAQAYTGLDKSDAILGPAKDGGYYLLGLKINDSSLFTDMVWSTETVADRTRERIARLGWSLLELPVLQDIDTFYGEH